MTDHLNAWLLFIYKGFILTSYRHTPIRVPAVSPATFTTYNTDNTSLRYTPDTGHHNQASLTTTNGNHGNAAIKNGNHGITASRTSCHGNSDSGESKNKHDKLGGSEFADLGLEFMSNYEAELIAKIKESVSPSPSNQNTRHIRCNSQLSGNGFKKTAP